MQASEGRKKMKKTVDRKSAGRAKPDGKVFVGFWTSPAVKAAISTRAMLDRKSASALVDEVITNWICGRVRK